MSKILDQVEIELKKTALNYHVIISWVAIFLNPLWAISDYFNSPKHFTSFFIFRITVTLLILGFIFARKKFVLKPEIYAFIPFLGISVENAFMYSLMNPEEMRNHTLSYIALFIGAGLFVVWKPIYSILIVVISLIANLIFFSLYSSLSVDEILTHGGLLTMSVALFTIILIYTRTNLIRKTILAQLELAESNHELELKKAIIEEKNKNIEDSLNYAQRIQHAIFPPLTKIENSLKDFFIFFKPKDIVSGDFYWFSSVTTTPQKDEVGEEVIVIAAVDCTGHGVPGALMSIIGSTVLNQSLTEPKVNSPAEALRYLDEKLVNNLNSINDGMDIALCSININTMKLQYSGAYNPLYIVRNKELVEIKADKIAVGGNPDKLYKKDFTNHSFSLEKNDCIYLFTDGYADQFGGESGKKLKYKKFQELLIENSHLPMKEQNTLLADFFHTWKGTLEQVDDVLVIGIRV